MLVHSSCSSFTGCFYCELIWSGGSDEQPVRVNEWMNGLSTLSDRFKLVLVHYCQSVLLLPQFQEWKLFLFKDNSYYTSFIGGACVIYFWLSFFSFSGFSFFFVTFFFRIWFISVFLNVINEGVVRFKKERPGYKD